MKIPLPRLLLVVTAILASTAGIVPAQTELSKLDGTSWILTALPGHAKLPIPAATARFEGGQVVGTDGCNRYRMGYAITNGVLKVNPLGPSTQMACPPEIMKQAEAFRFALTQAARYRVTSFGGLELLAGDDAVLAQFSPQPQGLAGPKWKVLGFNNGKQALVSVLNHSKLTMEFSADGKVSGSSGCNQFRGTYRLDGSALSFGPLAGTRMMCPDPKLMEQERQFLNALATVATARFEADHVEFRTADGALAVTLLK